MQLSCTIFTIYRKNNFVAIMKKGNETIAHSVDAKRRVRKSMSREAILSIMKACHQPISAYGIMNILAQEKKVFNKTTIYRELENLKRLGVIKELFLRNDSALYELSGEHHHHTICISCGSIQHLAIDEPKEWLEKHFLKKEGFIVVDHSLEFFGVCRACQ